MILYVARHGQTQWNVDKRICGRTDLPLTEVGLFQAEQLADHAAQCSIDVIIASPMLRAQQTAQAVSRRIGIEILTDNRLIEQDYGSYEGLNRLTQAFVDNKRQFAMRCPGGESTMQLAYRVYSLIEEIRQKYKEKNVLLVCHGGICRVIRSYFEDMTNEEYANYSEDNAVLRAYEW